MGPLTLQAFTNGTPDLRHALADAQHFLIEDRMFETVNRVINDINAAHPNAPCALQLMMPAPTTVFETSNWAAMMNAASDGCVQMWFATRDEGFTPICCFRSRSTSFQPRAPLRSREQIQLACSLAQRLDLLADLISEPRLVRRRDLGRQMRRAAERATSGVAPAAWHSVSWTVGDEVCPKSADALASHRLPLHFARAHWRKYDQETAHSELRPGRPGHWVWVKHAWKGHPDYGIRLHHYTPDIDPDGKSAAVIADAKRSATEQARAAAIEAWNGRA
ncbi:hypothetical protein [Oceanicella sp. SM1341]|uniref:hypothetical protein n=1 Tax=Oceanicella sp. SM1341 TaxID=1548889 RepID=UPI000E4C54AE|nr:hypothetical protein [Oceanicella sp. SM1341]